MGLNKRDHATNALELLTLKIGYTCTYFSKAYRLRMHAMLGPSAVFV